MLAILLIEMEWLKESRTAEGAVARQQYYKPVLIEEEVNLTGEGVFVKRCRFYQKGNKVQSASEMVNMQNIDNASDVFVSIDRIDIPCISVEKEESNYRIKWFDYRGGMPRRRGGNEDFGKKGKKLAGEPNVLNETAFVLEEGKAGLLKYNYRYTSFHGQWYKCYYVYVVSCKELTRDIFVRDYDYEYNQLADLF